jgi:hypothetical protein
MVPRKIGDMKIAESSQSLNITTINANTISVWYSSIRSLNYDENIDHIPMNEGKAQRSQQVSESYQGPERMEIDPPIQPLHQNPIVKSHQTSEELKYQA